MRKIKTKLRRTINDFLITTCLIVIVAIAHLISKVPPQTLLIFGGTLFFGFFCWIIFRRKPEKYINKRGYVVLTAVSELEHRYIAKQILGRELRSNEVVHHINGNKIDNQLRNLCLMDGEKHEHFHSWLSWKRKKSGKYPPFKILKRVLSEEYGGTLLEYITPTEKKVEHEQSSNIGDAISNNTSRGGGLGSPKKLFNELRDVRKKLATEKSLPVYMIFDNRTLHEMAEAMPDTEATMLEIRGVGPTKFQMYGTHFILVIKRFKATLEADSKRKKDSA